MLSSPLPKNVDHLKVFRASILNGVTPPAATVAVLESRGINTGALEMRLRQSLGA